MVALETIGIITLAISGALVGVKKKQDVFGAVILGIAAALGGIVLRDLLLSNMPSAVFEKWSYAGIAAGASLVTFFAAYLIRDEIGRYARVFNTMLSYMDAVGMAVFTILGVKAALDLGQDPKAFFVVFTGVLAGIGGGVLRDMLVREIPYALHKRIYIPAAVLGAILYYFLQKLGVPQVLACVDGAACIILLRLLISWTRWELPKIS